MTRSSSRPRQFPTLNVSTIRRLGTRSALSHGLLLWQSGHVVNHLISSEEAMLLGSVLDGPQRLCQVAIRHEAGDEFSSQCQCDDEGLCQHALAILWAWVYETHRFEKVRQLDELSSAAQPQIHLKRQWHEYLKASNTNQLRAMARRHQFPLNGNEHEGLLLQLVERLADPATIKHAMSELSEGQRQVLQMLYVLSDGQPNSTAQDVQLALGWQSLEDVQLALRELGEWGLVATVPSAWLRFPPYSLAPAVAQQIAPALKFQPTSATDSFEQPRTESVAAYPGDLNSLEVLQSERSLPELLLLARHIPLQLRALPAEPADLMEALRQWPYLIEELVKLQVKPGWLHQSDSLLTVPPSPPLYDDESLARFRELTGDDALSEFVSRLLPPPQPLPRQSVEGTLTLSQIFERWQQLESWTELWPAQQPGMLGVRRAVMNTHFTYAQWLRQLARGRRFVSRVLALLGSNQWYDFESLLKFVHTIQRDFLRERPPYPTMQPSWWLEVLGKKVDPQSYQPWRESYGLFIEHMLRGPLFWLGAVRLARSAAESGFGYNQTLAAFQITPVGEALLRGNELPAPPYADPSLRLDDELRAYVPMGRQELGAYRLLERLADFEQVRDGQAVYQFNLRQAHAAFESGLTADDVVTQLAQLTGASLPAVVCAQWHDWWSRYAQIRWYDGLTLIEFADDYVLQELLSQTDLGEHILFTFSPRLAALRPESADAVARQLVKKGYTPKIE